MIHFHFLRPWWLLAFIVLGYLLYALWQQNLRLHHLKAICDPHLLKVLIKTSGENKHRLGLICLGLSASFMIISLSGPSWSRLPVPTFQQWQPKVLVLDLSTEMLNKDLKPDRLTRAKFKLHDLLNTPDQGQFALVVYTGEPFIVSPLTDDGQTIDALLPSLSPDIMPVEGQRLSKALEEAGKLIKNAGFKEGEILVLTGNSPSLDAEKAAKNLAANNIYTSVMPVISNKTLNPLFQQLANAGQGKLVPFSDTSSDIDSWLASTKKQQEFNLNKKNNIPIWRDEGRKFLFGALIFLLPVFRRGWMQRISV